MFWFLSLSNGLGAYSEKYILFLKSDKPFNIFFSLSFAVKLKIKSISFCILPNFSNTLEIFTKSHYLVPHTTILMSLVIYELTFRLSISP